MSQRVRRFLWGGAGALAFVFLMGTCVNTCFPTVETNTVYDNCAAGVKRAGIPESHPDFAVPVGQCIERVEAGG